MAYHRTYSEALSTRLERITPGLTFVSSQSFSKFRYVAYWNSWPLFSSRSRTIFSYTPLYALSDFNDGMFSNSVRRLRPSAEAKYDSPGGAGCADARRSKNTCKSGSSRRQSSTASGVYNVSSNEGMRSGDANSAAGATLQIYNEYRPPDDTPGKCMYTDKGIFVNISEISASVRGKCATDQASSRSVLGLLTMAEANLEGVIVCES